MTSLLVLPSVKSYYGTSAEILVGIVAVLWYQCYDSSILARQNHTFQNCSVGSVVKDSGFTPAWLRLDPGIGM